MSTAQLSTDSQAIALVCSTVAGSEKGGPKPLTPSEWRHLSGQLHRSDLRPRDLIEMGTEQLGEATGADPEMANRLTRLLSRGGQLALEIDRLAGLGIWILTRADEGYPVLWRERLGRQAPPLLFGAGPRANLRARGIAIVGSRDVEESGLAFAHALGRRCAEQGFSVVSGGARGVDMTAMEGAISRGGIAVGITVDPLERLVRRSELRAAIADEQLTLATPFHPGARWQTGNAMSRNRLVYTLSQASVVVASSSEKGGTRSGALENVKAGWVPLHVRDDASPGNSRLIAEGAMPLAASEPVDIDLERLAEAWPVPAPLPAAGQPAPPSDAFEAVWPLLEQALVEPATEREVAERLGLQPTQARAWLRRAESEGRAKATKRPKRWVIPESSVGQLRIDGA